MKLIKYLGEWARYHWAVSPLCVRKYCMWKCLRQNGSKNPPSFGIWMADGPASTYNGKRNWIYLEYPDTDISIIQTFAFINAYLTVILIMEQETLIIWYYSSCSFNNILCLSSLLFEYHSIDPFSHVYIVITSPIFISVCRVLTFWLVVRSMMIMMLNNLSILNLPLRRFERTILRKLSVMELISCIYLYGLVYNMILWVRYVDKQLRNPIFLWSLMQYFINPSFTHSVYIFDEKDRKAAIF